MGTVDGRRSAPTYNLEMSYLVTRLAAIALTRYECLSAALGSTHGERLSLTSPHLGSIPTAIIVNPPCQGPLDAAPPPPQVLLLQDPNPLGLSPFGLAKNETAQSHVWPCRSTMATGDPDFGIAVLNAHYLLRRGKNLHCICLLLLFLFVFPLLYL